MTKTYPLRCQSAYCGKPSCEGCPNKPELDAFKRWVRETGAVVPDPVWSPTVYVIRPAE